MIIEIGIRLHTAIVFVSILFLLNSLLKMITITIVEPRKTPPLEEEDPSLAR